MASPPDHATLAAIRREVWQYQSKKPGRVPPADSPNRPYSAWLWNKANAVIHSRPKARTFTYVGYKFQLVWMAGQLCVLDLCTRQLLVKTPTSHKALHKVLAEYGGRAR